MRILCIAEAFPWPEVSGYQVRLSNIVRALADVADVDFFAAVQHQEDDGSYDVPRDIRLSRFRIVNEQPPRAKALRLAQWLVSGLPRTLLWRRWSVAREVLSEWKRPSYDLVWFSHIDAFLGVGDLVQGPRVVDLDTLEDQRLQHRRTARSADSAAGRKSSTQGSVAYRAARRLVDPVDVRRWRRLQWRLLASADVVTVCSEIDRQRLQAENVVVLPNGYDAPRDSETMRDEDRGTAIVAMVGVLAYEPNSDGALWFADEAFPLILTERADAEFRVVGRPHESVARLDARQGIVLRGFVDDISAELGEVDIEVVPLRSGGGTRVKVLEAFAHRVPVVSTSVGCEGLDVVDGEHLLIANDASGFAAACLRLLGDASLRRRLSNAAADLVAARYSWEHLRPLVVELASSTATGRLRAAPLSPAG